MLNINDLNELDSFDPLNPTTLPNKTGLYFICIRNEKNLPALEKEGATLGKDYGRNDILYIGISKSKRGLRGRDCKDHFTGPSKKSTLRRSIGSLKGWGEADRVRQKNAKKSLYSFKTELECKLRDWMKNNLIMFYQARDGDIKELEIELIKKISPPLNILHNRKSPVNAEFVKKLEALRTDYQCKY